MRARPLGGTKLTGTPATTARQNKPRLPASTRDTFIATAHLNQAWRLPMAIISRIANKGNKPVSRVPGGRSGPLRSRPPRDSASAVTIWKCGIAESEADLRGSSEVFAARPTRPQSGRPIRTSPHSRDLLPSERRALTQCQRPQQPARPAWVNRTESRPYRSWEWMSPPSPAATGSADGSTPASSARPLEPTKDSPQASGRRVLCPIRSDASQRRLGLGCPARLDRRRWGWLRLAAGAVSSCRPDRQRCPRAFRMPVDRSRPGYVVPCSRSRGATSRARSSSPATSSSPCGGPNSTRRAPASNRASACPAT